MSIFTSLLCWPSAPTQNVYLHCPHSFVLCICCEGGQKYPRNFMERMSELEYLNGSPKTCRTDQNSRSVVWCCTPSIFWWQFKHRFYTKTQLFFQIYSSRFFIFFTFSFFTFTVWAFKYKVATSAWTVIGYVWIPQIIKERCKAILTFFATSGPT